MRVLLPEGHQYYTLVLVGLNQVLSTRYAGLLSLSHTCPIPLQDVQWTFECPLDISVRPLDEWTFECPLDNSVCSMDEWTFECRMDISVRPLVEWTYECPMDISIESYYELIRDEEPC